MITSELNLFEKEIKELAKKVCEEHIGEVLSGKDWIKDGVCKCGRRFEKGIILVSDNKIRCPACWRVWVLSEDGKEKAEEFSEVTEAEKIIAEFKFNKDKCLYGNGKKGNIDRFLLFGSEVYDEVD